MTELLIELFDRKTEKFIKDINYNDFIINIITRRINVGLQSQFGFKRNTIIITVKRLRKLLKNTNFFNGIYIPY